MGTVFNIQRFSTSDGPGIRTVVFLKGCPLRCGWCHNPESQRLTPQIFYNADACIGCGACIPVCPKRCHSITPNSHHFDRTLCTACGKCTQACNTNALELCGQDKTVEEILTLVLRDLPFYTRSGGGLTISGGEPLAQFEFTYALLHSAKEKGLHTALETCGYTNMDLDLLLPYVDCWLYDVKLLDNEQHRRHTGVSTEIILQNLKKVDQGGGNVILRCPIIPGVNTFSHHFNHLAALANSLQHVSDIHLEPYHPLGLSKAQRLEQEQPFKEAEFLGASDAEYWAKHLQAKTDIPVIIL
ncbi:MAG: glycyl-radical enzyme activating protein [Clostridia bacterium]|nr:glycyl-radical enzyme activating protein [Clostridia bacterium]